MPDQRPGLNLHRLVTLMRSALEQCQLDLSDRVVLTEAASGAYVVTPILAAMARAKRVYAMTRSTRYGTVEDITAQTLALADLAGVQDRLEIITHTSQAIVSQADIVTNSGHVRPIDAKMVSWMQPTAVIPLMYEAWEFRPDDVDLAACQQRGILVAGTNECHPAVDVFSFLGIMAMKLLIDAGIAVYTSRILLLCDNPFAPFIERSLLKAGASVDVCAHLAAVTGTTPYDALLVALRPQSELALSAHEAHTIAQHWPGAVVVQFWGNINRTALAAAQVPVWPCTAPALDHMGILPSDIGPEPVVRLQAGGLKVAQVLLQRSSPSNRNFLDMLQFV